MREIDYGYLRSKLLKYQNDKNELVKEYSGIDLVTKEALLDEDFFTEKVIEEIAYKFKSQNELSNKNCLHCNIFYYDCENCKVVKVDGKGCNDDESRFVKVLNQLKEKRSTDTLNEAILSLSTSIEQELILNVYGVKHKDDKVLSVVVDGTEVNDFLMHIEDARYLKESYLQDGYEDVDIVNMALQK